MCQIMKSHRSLVMQEEKIYMQCNTEDISSMYDCDTCIKLDPHYMKSTIDIGLKARLTIGNKGYTQLGHADNPGTQ